MFGKNKRSVIVLIVISFWLSYVSLTGVLFYRSAKESTEMVVTDRQKSMSFVQDSVSNHLITENYDALKETLEKARALNFIDFYIVQNPSGPVIWYNNFNNLKGIDVEYQQYNVILESKDLSFRTIKIMDTKLTVGVFQDREKILWNQAWLMKWMFVQDIFLVTSVLGLIVFLLLKDIISLSKTLTLSKSRSELGNLKARSAEAHALINASVGFERERLRLEHLSETYGDTVGPALRHEMASGKPAPYTFEATLCRVDLNGYTQIFLEKSDKYLVNILNRYFARAREVIQRYDGLIYQFVGDEIVFQFKDETAKNLSSRTLAAACIRDLFEEAHRIEQELGPQAGHYFKLKASLAHGTMRFISLDKGHALSGLPLIESVRLLSLIDDKSHQVLSFFDSASVDIDGVAFIFDRQANQLKGFKQESLVCRARDFNSIEWVFEAAAWSKLAYFRSDRHFIQTLKKIRALSLTSSSQEIEMIFSALQNHRFQSVSEEVLKECGLILDHFISLHNQGILGSKPLAALVSLFGRVIPEGQISNSITQSLVQLLDHPEPRVQANSIVLLGGHGYPARKVWEKMHSSNNRVAADTIIEVAKQQLNDDLMRALDRLLESPDEVHRRSGQFARKNILDFYLQKDPVFYSANPYLEKLKKQKAA